MRRLKKLALAISLIGTSVIPACSTLTLTSLRDAAIAGAATFVETSIFDLLNAFADDAETL